MVQKPRTNPFSSNLPSTFHPSLNPKGTAMYQSVILSTALLCLLTTPAWGQVYNPTASDLTTENTAGGTGALLPDAGTSNTAFGLGALGVNFLGYANTAFGVVALSANTTGVANTASGGYALYSNTTGAANTANGAYALYANTTGTSNAATGNLALSSNTTGDGNMATGSGALYANTTGFYNAAAGIGTLADNTTGFFNTAAGANALYSNTTGSLNTGLGMNALVNNTTGIRNTAIGSNALLSNTTGSLNTALGYGALSSRFLGVRNMALGWRAGALLTSGNDNLYLAHPGAATESKTIRLGDPAVQTRAFIAGVFSKPISGSQVMINSSGQLGVLASSARYKHDIAPMGEQLKLQQLRPVTFYYKEDDTATRQYGLIAEEVAKVYPELVIYNDQGGVEGVHYEALAPMLLNEVQRQQQELAELKEQVAKLRVLLDRSVSR